MRRLMLLAIVALGSAISAPAQLLLSDGQSYDFTFTFTDQDFFGDGYTGYNPAGANFATFYSDAGGTTPGSTFRVDLFENDASESVFASVSGAGFVTAQGVGHWQDLQGVARVTVTSGAVLVDHLVVNVYQPTGFGDFYLYSSGNVAVPEPGPMALCALGLAVLLGWNIRKR